MSLLHMGISATPVILSILFYFTNKDAKLDVSNSGDIFLTIVPVVALSSIFLSDFLFKKMAKSFPESDTLRDKLTKFQTASIIKYGILEGAALFSVVIFANTQNLIYLIIGVFLIFYLFLLKPTKQKIESVLNLTGEEKAKFDRANKVLD